MDRPLAITMLALALPALLAGAPADPGVASNPARPLRGTDPACDPPCAEVACGWAGNCFCSVCPPRQACLDGACRPTPRTVDPHEPNDTPGQARALVLPRTSEASLILEGAIGGPGDQDWFQVRTESPSRKALRLGVSLAWDARDRDLDLAVCIRCDTGDPAPEDPDQGAELVELDAPSPTTYCLASMRPWGLGEDVAWSPRCVTRSATRPADGIWIVVWPATARDGRTRYRLTVRTDDGSGRTESIEQSSAPVPSSTSIDSPGDT